MKQKYVIEMDPENGSLILKEFAELDKDILSFLCQQSYDMAAIEGAVSGGKPAMIAALRTDNMYPPTVYASEIAERAMTMLSSGDPVSQEILFDASTFLAKESEETIAEEEDEGEDGEEGIEDLLKGDVDEKYEGKNIGNLKSSIKIADNESLAVDDDAYPAMS